MSITPDVRTTTRTVRFAIRATPDQVWDALVDGAVTPQYYVGFEAHIEPSPGAPYRYTAGGGDMIIGEVRDAEIGRRLVTTFNGHWDPEVDVQPESLVTFELSDAVMPIPGVTLLTCRHEGLVDAVVADHLELGWVSILSGLKTLLETGRALAA
jgi:uncharacterized protein YndB with AHSA1/START domain